MPAEIYQFTPNWVPLFYRKYTAEMGFLMALHCHGGRKVLRWVPVAILRLGGSIYLYVTSLTMRWSIDTGPSLWGGALILAGLQCSMLNRNRHYLHRIQIIGNQFLPQCDGCDILLPCGHSLWLCGACHSVAIACHCVMLGTACHSAVAVTACHRVMAVTACHSVVAVTACHCVVVVVWRLIAFWSLNP